MNIFQLKHIQDQDFLDLVAALSQALQNRVARQFQVLQENPLYPSLHFKKVSVGLWSIRITNDYRALGYEDGDRIVWYWIGPHSEYERMIRRSKIT